MRLKDKVAIVTGGGHGIGRAAAIRFAEEGARVAVSCRTESKGNAVADEIRQHGGDALYVRCDVLKESDTIKLADTTAKTLGKIDILFSNHANNKDFKSVGDAAEEDWVQEVDVTLKGSFFLCKSVLPYMIEQGGGAILIDGSIHCFVAGAGYGAYCASKGGLLMMCKSLAVDYAKHNIRVNILCPGPIDTPAFDPYRDDEAVMQSCRDMTLLKRLGEPREVANAALFLVSDEASYITGTSLLVDGGCLAQLPTAI